MSRGRTSARRIGSRAATSTNWGGRRRGAGRPPGSGRYGVPTRAVRVPEHLCRQIQSYVAEGLLTMPLYSNRVAAGFPSAADDFVERRLDINELVVRRPHATFLLQVEGCSMTGAGILEGDFLVVDRSLEACSGDIVVASVDGEFTVKRYRQRGERQILAAEHPDYRDIVLSAANDNCIWGVVCGVVRQLSRR